MAEAQITNGYPSRCTIVDRMHWLPDGNFRATAHLILFCMLFSFPLRYFARVPISNKLRPPNPKSRPGRDHLPDDRYSCIAHDVANPTPKIANAVISRWIQLRKPRCHTCDGNPACGNRATNYPEPSPVHRRDDQFVPMPAEGIVTFRNLAQGQVASMVREAAACDLCHATTSRNGRLT